MTSEAGSTVVLGPDVRPFVMREHRCFGCGSLNDHGLRMTLHVEVGAAWTELTLEPRFEGWAGIAHGGILCTILDEVMAWSLVGAGRWGLTARLAVDFRRPVPLGQPIRADAHVTRTRRRLVQTAGRITDRESGEALATATATYVAADPTRTSELQARYGFRYRDGGAGYGAA